MLPTTDTEADRGEMKPECDACCDAPFERECRACGQTCRECGGEGWTYDDSERRVQCQCERNELRAQAAEYAARVTAQVDTARAVFERDMFVNDINF